MADSKKDPTTIEWQVARASEEYGDEFDPTLLALSLALYRALSVYERVHSMELAPHGLTVGQFNILTVLHRAERPLTMSELSRALSVRPSNLTSVVETMTQRKLVKRKIKPTDRRSLLISETAAAKRFLESFLPGHWQHLGQVLAGMTGEQRVLLGELLESLRLSVEAANVVHVDGALK